MTDTIDPVRTAAEITGSYRRYLQSLMAVRDPKLDAALREAIAETPMLDKGPYLEATPPYAPGHSLRELIDEGVLSSGFASLASDALPLDRPLYQHQEQSIRKANAGRNVVVATGTGSGKTESFLLPILDSLVRERENGTLGPGVRALLLYPMNALANDQMKRLRQMLASYPDVTFGRYTGETPQDPKVAKDKFHDLNIGEPLLANELISREAMRKSPPNLLLTNYAMLEYLLLRPLDMELFGEADSDHWRFIVVDEAHVYDGTQGAEVGMLLRRLRDRVAPDRSLQCIATSATVGGDTDPGEVTRFASLLFGEPFEWQSGDLKRQDLITATRVGHPAGPFWGPMSAAQYLQLARSADPEAAVLSAAQEAGFEGADAATALAHERSLIGVRDVLSGLPLAFETVAAKTFPGEDDSRKGLAALVDLASGFSRPDGTTALSARYHLFLRATEGAFTCLSPSGPHVHLARHEDCTDCHASVFEIGSCKRCGAVHVVGRLETSGGKSRLRPRRPSGGNTWLVLDDQTARLDEDEQAVTDESGDVDGDECTLCVECGTLGPAGASACASVTCGSKAVRSVRRLAQRGEEIAGCLVCGARGSGTVRLFETGPDASGAVITTTLYQSLPISSDPTDGRRPGEGRKLLMFSDSRQAAAYFAPYLEDSYARLQRRRLIVQGLERGKAEVEPVGISDVVFQTRAAAAAVQQFPRRMTSQQQAREVSPWVMAEVLATDDRQSLEGLGLMAVELDRDPSWPTPQPLLQMGLTEAECWDFMQELVRTLRQQGAVTMPEEVPPNHEVFSPRLGPIRVRETGPEAVRKVLSWLPGKGTNRRIDYVTKVVKSLGVSADPVDVLRGIWRILTHESSQIDWLTRSTDKHLGVLHQIDHELLRIRWVGVKGAVYRCDRCRRSAPLSVRGICPALGCEGSLEQVVPPEPADERDHYRATYQRMHPVPLSAKEHTAQWSSEKAAEIQNNFVRGVVNALSCSTTFELGVDVGELQAVFLRNMPPTTANYVQRAGRAGRRAGAAALVVTYAQRRSHDLSRYAEPEVMMAGNIRTPFVPLDNERIDRRHAQSVAMSAFFRWYFENTRRICRTVSDFFITADGGNDVPVSQVAGFLNPVPDRVTQSLRNVLPESVQAGLDVEGGGWVDSLVELLETVRHQVTADVHVLDELRIAAAEAKNYGLADRYQKVVATLQKRDLLGYLANHNVLPKYGFPVDTVELRTAFSNESHGLGKQLDLTRDLSQAIFEYAPDATLVAGGQMWTSRGIYRLPGRALEEFEYLVCDGCSGFRRAVAGVDPICPHCGHSATKAPRRLTVPEFGFIAAKETTRPGSRPPRRSWSGAVHVLKPSPEVRDETLTLAGGRLETSVGPRGTMLGLADGPRGMGFWICEWCGHGSARINSPTRPPKHQHPMRHKDCNGKAQLLDLAHSYETDLLTIKFAVPGQPTNIAAWKSVLYAVLEASCEALELARDDIGGTLAPTGDSEWSLVLFDAVPGGAGHVLMVESNLQRVLKAALHRVESCECGAETSCYGCLRTYGNQRDHDDLSRGVAAHILGRLLRGHGKGSEVVHEEASGLPGEWQDVYDQALPDERVLLRELAIASVPLPVVGHESDQGIPIPVSWPAANVALSFGLEPQDAAVLESDGWHVVEPEAAKVVEALAARSSTD